MKYCSILRIGFDSMAPYCGPNWKSGSAGIMISSVKAFIIFIIFFINCGVSLHHPNRDKSRWKALFGAGLMHQEESKWGCSSDFWVPSKLPEPPAFSGSAYRSNAVLGTAVYVSTSFGNDANDGAFPDNQGSGSGPFKTIAPAIAKAKSIRAAQTSPSAITLIIREGVYYQDQTLTVTDLPNFTITRYMGEHPVISGGKKLSGWELSYPDRNPPIWSTRYPGSGDLVSLSHNLWVDGHWAVKARYPKNDAYFSSPELDRDDFWMYSDDGKLLAEPNPNLDFVNIGFEKWNDAANWNIDGSEIFIYEQPYDLRNYSLEGYRLSAQNGYFAFYGPAKTILSPTRFFVANVFELMTNEGEWFLDQKERCLSQRPECGRWIFYIPKGGKNPNTSVTVVSAVSPLLSISGENVTIDGITFSNTSLPDAAAVDILGGKNITITNSFFKNLTGSGVSIGAGSQSVTVLRNVFSDIGMSGIRISAASPSKDLPGKNIILGNYIVRSGLMGGQSSSAIQLNGSNDNIIQENQIDRSKFIGISAAIYMPENEVFFASQRNLIAGNEVAYSAIGSADQSGIYIGGHKPGAEWANNWIIENRVLQTVGNMRSDSPDKASIQFWGVDGIFLDDNSSGNLVHRNIVSNSSRASIHINKGTSNRITQNILAGDSNTAVFSNWGAEENEFFGNYVIDMAAQPVFKVWSNDSGTSQMGFSHIDGNLYWLKGRDASFIGFSPSGTFNQWQGGGVFDLNSGFVSDNAGAAISPNEVVLGNISGSRSGTRGCGPNSELVTGLRRFAVRQNDPSTECIKILFGDQYSPQSNVDPGSVYNCLVP